MAKLPFFKRFVTEDFPGGLSAAVMIGKFFYQINLILNLFFSSLDNDVTLQDNIFSQLSTYPVTGLTPVITFPYKFSPELPIGMSVINVVQTNQPEVVLTAAVDCSWVCEKGNITARVRGLDSASKYNVTFIVWGG